MPTTSSGAAGVPVSNKLPSVFLQVAFGQSPNSAGGAARRILLLGNKTSAGSMTVDTQRVTLTSADDAKTYAGEGSELHLAAQVVYAKYPAATVDMIAVTEPAGTKATATFTVTGAATGSGTLRIYIHGVRVDVAVYSGDSANTIASNVSAAINGLSRLLNVTASPSTNTVVVTARHNGTRSNSIRVRYTAETSITGSTFAWSGSTLSTGTGDDSLTAALATAATTREHLYASAHMVTSQLQAIQTQLNTMAGPLVGKRQQSVNISVAVLGTATTQAETLNAERMQLLWYPNSDSLPFLVVAAWCALRAQAEESSYSTNLSSFNPTAVDLWTMIGDQTMVGPQASTTDYVTDSQAAAALDVGLTPVQVAPGTLHPYVPLSITTHSNDAGGNPDTRTLCTNYVTVPDAFADELAAYVPSAFPDLKLQDDPLDGDDPLPPKVTTPGVVKAQVYTLYRRQFADKGHVKNSAIDFASWAFNLDSSNLNRLNATMSVTPAPWFTQFSGKVAQLTA